MDEGGIGLVYSTLDSLNVLFKFVIYIVKHYFNGCINLYTKNTNSAKHL
jgi:hypothetical protein